jgi:AcrR family transcriptional regulator
LSRDVLPIDQKPLRADAARNRSRVLDAARTLFAQEGVDVPLDEIARRAGVGAGTVHRHFPTKNLLVAAILAADLERRAEEARALASDPDPGAALFALVERLLNDGTVNRGLRAALAESGSNVSTIHRDTTTSFRRSLAELLAAAERAGAVREDLDVDELKAVLAGLLVTQENLGPNEARLAHVRAVVLDGLRPR